MSAKSLVDAKMLHHVKKFASSSSSPDLSSQSSVDSCVSFLLRNHREYQRKQAPSLRAAVSLALSQLSPPAPPAAAAVPANPAPARAPSPTTTPSSSAAASPSGPPPADPSLSKKRKPAPDEGEGSEEREARAREAVAMRGNGNALNNAIRSKYNAQTSTTPLNINPPQHPSGNPSSLSLPPTPPSSHPSPSAADLRHPATQTKKKLLKKSPGTFRHSSSSSPGPPDSQFGSLAERPTARYADLGGVESILQTVRELIEYPLSHPEIYSHIGVEPPRGILLHGPPGCGKTLLANAMAGQLGVSFLKISAPEIVSGMSGESEQKVREIFGAAVDNAPAILFIDEVDAIMSKRDGNARGMEKRIVAQLLTCMDGLAMENTGNKPVMVIGATNRPDSLDSALRRAGRFDREICMGVPDERARCRILKVMTSKMRLSGDFDFDAIAKKTPGYVGADIRSLTKEAAVIAINRIFKDMLNLNLIGTPTAGNGQSGTSLMSDPPAAAASQVPFQAIPLSPSQLEPLSVTMDDFLQAVKTVQPSSKREGFATVPDVTWSQIGALSDIRSELEISILEPIANPERFEQLGLSMPAGVMLYGPPGCGKTLLAKAIANESGANFISVKGPELLDKYVGESERAVRQVFERARASSPCVVFFDELDSLCPRRGSDGGGGGGVSERVVNQLLTELDGLDSRKSVFVIAATNRPELIDPAMLRPGRLDKLMYIPLPSSHDRASIMTALCAHANIASCVDVAALARGARANGYSGADLSALLREAGLACLKENTASKKAEAEGGEKAEVKIQIEGRHFDAAFDAVMPSVSKDDQREYDKIRDRISRARSRQGAGAGAGGGGEGGGGEGEPDGGN
ncbi:hypothetical protein TeGR_g1380, partial [Tetraparma gracilis]